MYNLSLLNPYNGAHNFSFSNPSYQSLQQGLSLANFYALNQFKQQLEMNAKIQALAQAQLQKQMQVSLESHSRKQSCDSTYWQQSPLSNFNAFPEKIKLERGCQNTKAIFKQEEVSSKTGSLDLEAQIREMLNYFTNRFNKSNQEEITQERSKYQSSLLQLFDELTKRYASASRCREDMLRSVLRKALTFLRNRLRNQCMLGARAASIAMCKRYFGQKVNEMLENVHIEDENEILAFLLPYRKNSRNRTANGRFATEIFSSEEFRKDYVYFLEKLDELFYQDNQKKIDKFADFLEDCVRHDSIHKVRAFKRFPWTEDCLASAKIIAYELLNISPKHTSCSDIILEETFPRKRFHTSHTN